MPVMVSMLKSYSGVGGRRVGFLLENDDLLIVTPQSRHMLTRLPRGGGSTR